ncbi:MAG: glutamyl-tRNA reductase [Acidobacteriota bacterium]
MASLEQNSDSWKKLLLVGISHKTAPVEIREKVSFPELELPQATLKLRTEYELPESLILSTCNRVEVLAHSEDHSRACLSIRDFLHRHHSLQDSYLEKFLYNLSGDQVIRHVFRVASSLDSLVVGEAQILGQLKKAYARAHEMGRLGVGLEKLVPQAFFVAKRIRRETRIGNSSVSVSSVSVRLAERIFGRLEGKAVLLIGAGQMAEQAAVSLMRAGISKVSVINRSLEAARSLARRLRGEAAGFEELERCLTESDVVLVSTGAGGYVLQRAHLERAIRKRKYRPLFLIDIAVPRNVDPAIHKIENVFLFDIDDLESVVESNLGERRQSALQAEEIIEEEVQKFVQARAADQVGPMIDALRRQFEEICLRDFEYHARQLDDRGREMLQMHLRQAAHRLAHPLIVEIKRAARGTQPESLELIRRLFKLDEGD